MNFYILKEEDRLFDNHRYTCVCEEDINLSVVKDSPHFSLYKIFPETPKDEIDCWVDDAERFIEMWTVEV